MKKSLIIAVVVLAGGILLWLQLGKKEAREQVLDFQQCVAAGNPVAESYPRQCRHGGQTFVDIVAPTFSQQEAALAKAGESEDCRAAGGVTERITFNDSSMTWWIDIEKMPDDAEHEGCNPACVVSENAETAEVNWRCTGADPGLAE